MARREQVRIAMADGVSLSATLYFPAEGDGPWPAAMEALPYRKDDVSSSYSRSYERLADGGYVVCSLDVRGTGSSGGIATDEYSAAERSDLVEVIAWLAAQPWSAGTVGMFGTSYGGFTSLQAAYERPPALKAIVPVFASDDRYRDDVHYYGGALKQLDVVDYPTYMVAMNALPPVPSLWGEDWRDEWLRRIEETQPWFLTWMAHQRRDDYWRYGSTREDPTRIEAATMIVGGWADGYTNIALRSFERMTAPLRLLLGPWSHASTSSCRPGPNIDLTAEMIRWFDRWLKGIDNGIDREPPIVVYQQRSTAPDPFRAEVRGDWRYEPTWPPERLRTHTLRLAEAEPGGLAAVGDVLVARGDVGATAWISCAGGLPWGQSADQRPDEDASLTYTWPPLERDLELFGHPRLRVRVTCDQPTAYVSAKITDVFPDGSSSLVVRGMANLAHRGGDGEDGPEAVTPGEPVDLDLELEAIAWTLEAGHRLRLDLASADWPNAWPPPYAATLTFDRATARARASRTGWTTAGRRDAGRTDRHRPPGQPREHRGRLVALGSRGRPGRRGRDRSHRIRHRGHRRRALRHVPRQLRGSRGRLASRPRDRLCRRRELVRHHVAGGVRSEPKRTCGSTPTRSTIGSASISRSRRTASPSPANTGTRSSLATSNRQGVGAAHIARRYPHQSSCLLGVGPCTHGSDVLEMSPLSTTLLGRFRRCVPTARRHLRRRPSVHNKDRACPMLGVRPAGSSHVAASPDVGSSKYRLGARLRERLYDQRSLADLPVDV